MANDLNILETVVSNFSTLSGGRNDVVQLVSAKIAPDISGVLPASGSTLTPEASIQFDVTVTDGQGLSSIVIWVDYRNKEVTEVIYDGTKYESNFSGSVVGITNGFRYNFRRLGGFLAQPDIKIQATAFNGGVN
jgi:hypothetical protein